jgi:hypothetical protein
MSTYSRDLGYDRAVAWANDWDAKMRQEEEAEDRAEARVKLWRHTPHKPFIGLLGPNFCELCGSNVGLHDQLPYGEKETS